MPSLAMEVRVDSDPVFVEDKVIWRPNDVQTDDPRIRATYWAPYFGARNEGETLSSKEALRLFDYFLDVATRYGRNTNHIVEQFNFSDNSPHFDGVHAQIDSLQMREFIKGATRGLRDRSRGYGLWTYRDYRQNLLYNGSFERGLDGWETTGSPTVESNVDQDKALRLTEGESISQSFSAVARDSTVLRYETLTLCANLKGMMDSEVSIRTAAGGVRTISVSGGAPEICIGIPSRKTLQDPWDRILVSVTRGEVLVDDLNYYAHVQRLGVYDEKGKAGSYLVFIQEINQDLQ